ncbi:MAG TPA: DUF5666 domain-containing protein [Pyrinomonadaceae bacterium]|jgi:hypothetical protein|nr:DUF5666 domain-containing protein [Pyrinomonadaceae bacterium]
MHRSPNAFLAAVFLLAFAVSGWSQSNPATPKPGSGVPQTPITAPNTAPPQTTAPAPSATVPDTTPPATPTATPATGAQPGNQGDQQKSTDQQKASSTEKTKTEKTSTDKTSTDKNGTAQPAPTATPIPQANPKTDILDSSATSGALVTDGHDPILDAPPVPRTTTTMVGGTISKVDRMRNRMTVHVFGGNHWTVNFDERTHIFHNGAETTQLALKKGERVYVDTQLDNNKHDIFARNIRVGVAALPADADGQIIAVDPKHNELTLRDSLNSVPVRFAVDPETRISNGQTPASFKDVKPGTLVHVRFSASSPNRGLAREVSIVAAPGSVYTFAGKVTFLDLHRGLLALQNSTDDRNYEIHFAPEAVTDRSNLGVGRDVLVRATFEGTRYTAQSVNLTRRDEEK